MLYVVCYDISDDRLRNQMSDRLLDFGTRIQESVFECLLDHELYDRMIDRLSRIHLAESDRVRVYRVCANCIEQVRIYGPGDLTRAPDFYLV